MSDFHSEDEGSIPSSRTMFQPGDIGWDVKGVRGEFTTVIIVGSYVSIDEYEYHYVLDRRGARWIREEEGQVVLLFADVIK